MTEQVKKEIIKAYAYGKTPQEAAAAMGISCLLYTSGMDRLFAWVNAGFDSEKAEKNLREMAVKSTHEALSGVEDALDSFTRDLNLDPAQQAGENIPQSVALGIAENGYLVYDAAKENGNQIPAGLGDGIGESSGIATDAIFDLNRDLDADVYKRQQQYRKLSTKVLLRKLKWKKASLLLLKSIEKK